MNSKTPKTGSFSLLLFLFFFFYPRGTNLPSLLLTLLTLPSFSTNKTTKTLPFSGCRDTKTWLPLLYSTLLFSFYFKTTKTKLLFSFFFFLDIPSAHPFSFFRRLLIANLQVKRGLPRGMRTWGRAVGGLLELALCRNMPLQGWWSLSSWLYVTA